MADQLRMAVFEVRGRADFDPSAVTEADSIEAILSDLREAQKLVDQAAEAPDPSTQPPTRLIAAPEGGLGTPKGGRDV